MQFNLVGLLLIRNVDTYSDKADKRAVASKTRHSDDFNPAILPIMSFESGFYSKRLLSRERRPARVQVMLTIIRVERLCPTRSDFSFQGSAAEIQPALVDKLT